MSQILNEVQTSTIAAISTAIGGGIAIIRLSGPMALDIAKALFRPKGGNCAFLSHRLYYGHVVEDGRVLDECMLTIMKAPRSYTREDVVEISSHGGAKSAERILAALLSKGATLAEPGEFTKRAFLNGRLDLSEAVAVIDIINAKTELSHNQALDRLSGRLSGDIRAIRDTILDILARIEAAIDYPEYDMDDEALPSYKYALDDVKTRMDELLEASKIGIILADGLKTVILGRPNVGKSSLLNAMLGQDRAIITAVPGTTRDVLTETVSVKGIPLIIADTAGLRESSDIVESLGIEKSMAYAKDADLILYVLDGSAELSPEDAAHIAALSYKKILFIINKADLRRELDISGLETIAAMDHAPVEISAKSRTGLDELYERIYGLFISGDVSIENTAVISNTRDEDSLKKAVTHITAAISAIDEGLGADMAAIDIKEAYVCLGLILGESLEDDIIDRIFSKFCLGK